MPADNLYPQLEQRLIVRAQQPAIQAVIIGGSRARSSHSTDEWSDLDLVVFARNATSYLRDSAWLNNFGTVLAAVSHVFGQHDRAWIAVYAEGTKLDAAFLSIDLATPPTLPTMLDAFSYPLVLPRGLRVRVDKTGAVSEMRLPSIDPPRPTATDFAEWLNRMWLDAILQGAQ
jgi:predicted nucleotidyltransferase